MFRGRAGDMCNYYPVAQKKAACNRNIREFAGCAFFIYLAVSGENIRRFYYSQRLDPVIIVKVGEEATASAFRAAAET